MTITFCLRLIVYGSTHLNSLRPRPNRRHFADDTFKRIFLNENVRISIKISLKFVPKGPSNNNPALVQIMAWRRSGDEPLSEPMMVSVLTLTSVLMIHNGCNLDGIDLGKVSTLSVTRGFVNHKHLDDAL